MLLHFFKYHGTGNDFILIDNRQEKLSKNDTKLIQRLCDRHFGIGADGLILMERDASVDFNMRYFNADGKPGSMCGNGGRCAVAFAQFLGMIEDEATFLAAGARYQAKIEGQRIHLHMQDVQVVETHDSHWFVDTGSPHHVELVDRLSEYDVRGRGADLRYNKYGESGSNINFVEQRSPNSFEVRTYERGVEDETLSCGTGVTAVALAMHHSGKTQAKQVEIITHGGKLEVRFEGDEKGYFNIQLIGPAEQVFKGYMEC